MGYKGAYTFYTLSGDSQNKWMDGLKQYCILQDIPNEYDIGPKIGEGNFSYVCLINY